MSFEKELDRLANKYWHKDSLEIFKADIRELFNYKTMDRYYDFEDWLKSKHSEDYRGVDDDMPDAFGEWMVELDVDTWLKYSDEYIALLFKQIAELNPKKL